MILRSFGKLRTQDRRKIAGATLLEILVAMLVIGLVSTGIVTAFIFSRRVTWRSSTELSGAGFVTETAEALRGAVGRDLPNGLSLAPGIYVDQNMQNRPTGSTPIAGLNLPNDFRVRFQTDPGTGPSLLDTDNDLEPDHGDGRVAVVEDITQDLDGDGQRGLDLDADGVTDLRRVHIRVEWTSPTT